MSTPVDNSLTSLKASTAQIMAIISGAQQIPPGNSHFYLTTQAQVIKDYGSGPLPSIVLSCSKELVCVQGMTPQTCFRTPYPTHSWIPYPVHPMHILSSKTSGLYLLSDSRLHPPPHISQSCFHPAFRIPRSLDLRILTVLSLDLFPPSVQDPAPIPI
ncbi:uncharacterized protein BJ212DRAFT_1476694 [Suillus subaureus]|uniref:Uncharacterized protein n=1 Tax=Suillus subaureus TaxID=48587 RepID=A0A9P7JI63_9AGAM|nr:uncharacterized protein BJ212DRAFT_1476694 [Suillus subaureus]KAG1823830.1 hypothetical protein BJ212DRAFT_1476694 [Suillus subaureus]